MGTLFLTRHTWVDPPYVLAKLLIKLGLGGIILRDTSNIVVPRTSFRFFPSTALRTGSPVGRQNDGFLPGLCLRDHLYPGTLIPETRKPAISGGLFYSQYPV